MSSKFQHESLILSQSTCPPACRMNYFLVWIDEDGQAKGESLPVVALRTTVSDAFSRKRSGDEYIAAEISSSEMIETGWTFQGQEISTEALVLQDDCLVPTNEVPCSNSCGQLVLLPWPYDAERDAAEEAKCFKGLEDETRKKMATEEERRKKLEVAA